MFNNSKCFCGAETGKLDMCAACGEKVKGVGRVLLALIFIVAGWGKLTGFAGTVGMIDNAGYPLATLLALVALIVELGGGVALLAGYRVRCAALALAVFLALATLMFHMKLSEPLQQIMFFKNLAVLGGLLYVAAAGPGAWALGWKKEEVK